MEKLTRHLEQLIIQHDYAILPEFGGFIINYVPARIDETSNIISAPHKEVFFNPALNHNDGLLADALQRSENISFRKANLLIEESVEDLKKKLKNGETVQLGKIGAVKLDENGQTEFLPADVYDFLPDNLSNYNLRLGALLHNDDEHREIVLKIPKNRRRILTYAAILVGLVAIAILIPTLRTNFPSYFAKMTPFSFFASDTLAILDSMPEYNHLVVDTTSASYEHSVSNDTAAMNSNHLKTTSIDTSNTSGQKQPVVETGTAAAPAKNTINVANEPQPQVKSTSNNPVKSAAKKTIVRKMPSAATPWHVIAGSYKTKAEAMAKAHELQKQTAFRSAWLFYSPRLQKSNFPIVAANTLVFDKNNLNNTLAWHIIVANFETQKKAKRFIELMEGPTKTPLAAYGSNSSYRIVAASFKSEQEALAKLREIRKNREYVSAWVLYNPALLNYPVTPRKAVQPTPAAKPAAPKKATEAPKNWHIIVAQFETSNSARKYADEMARKEKIALSVYGTNNIYRVVAASFATQNEASAKVKEIRQHAAFKTALILHSSVLLNHPVQEAKPAAKPLQATTSKQQGEIPLLKPGTWYVITANYFTPQQAQTYAKNVGKKENVSLSVIKDNALYRVIGGAFNSQNDAIAKVRELHQHQAFSEAWTLHKPVK